MKRLPSATGLAALLLAGHALADVPPSKPANVRIAEYPGAGGELLWDRSTDDGIVVGYRLTLNGEPLGTFDALSYYDPMLPSNEALTFAIEAIDDSGQVSETAFAYRGPNPGPGIPRIPQGLRATVYSSTAAELFWERSAVPGGRYRVLRDGAEIGTTDGTSFFDDGLSPGTAYDYAVGLIVDGGGPPAAIIEVVTRGR